ncbi:Trans-enoyl reductase ccsC [Lachnellula arida]|uniref:Trans-enoyl reductase ccsC n=1 Tax=Lachnellula arida TaxID=1316785 RepID=A0A8T9B4Z3_9HELO|nr:Trans-enoyl reductase ccsC [Lachnellula arida]
MPSRFPSPGTLDGSDFAGTIIQLGEGISRTDLKVGDRVCGAVHASNPEVPQNGSYAEFLATHEDLILKVPEDVSWEDAAAIGGCVHSSIGYSLFGSLCVPGHPDKPAEKPVCVLVYGGATSCGTMAIQLLKAAGLKPITTCSPKNFPLVKSYGAEAAFDYSSPTCAEDIKAYTKNSLKYVLDIIAESQTMKLCYAAIGRTGGKYTGLEYVDKNAAVKLRKVVKPDWVLGVSLTGGKIALPGDYGSEADPERRVFAKEWFETMQRLLDEGTARSHPVRVMEGGFQGILEGLEILRRKEISGEKLVYHIPEQ